MKTYLTRLCFFLFLTGIVFAQADKTTLPAPKLSIEKTEHDFGQIKEGLPVIATFIFKNAGTADLKFEEGALSCGCTTLEYDKLIAPGQTGKVVVTLQPSGMGKFTKFAVLPTNDPAKPDLKLAIKYESFIPKGYRVGAFIFDPGDELNTKLEAGKNYQARIGFFYDGKELLKIMELKVDEKKFDVQLETVTEGRRYNVIVQSAAPLGVGIYKQKVKLLTNAVEQQEVELIFTVNVGTGGSAPAAAEKKVKTKMAGRKAN